jgi:thiol-disulfide isomerase/thioredoxin
MAPELIARVLLAAALTLGGLAAWVAYNRFILKQAAAPGRVVPGYRSGRPAILYFTTPTCAPCLTVQRPALKALQQSLGDALQVVEVDASRRTDLADAWGVLSVPTTFVIDASGRPRHVNHGVATAEKLFAQIKEFTK